MKRSHAASVLVAASATVMWMAAPAFAASGFGGNAAAGSGSGAHSARALEGNAAGVAARCWTDHDRDDRTGHPTDRDGDESARCHTRTHATRGDGDHDGDDVSPSRCFTDRDRDDRTGRPSDRDGDESCR